MNEDPNWPLLLTDLVGALVRLQEAKEAVAEAENDVALVLRVAKRIINEHSMNPTGEE